MPNTITSDEAQHRLDDLLTQQIGMLGPGVTAKRSVAPPYDTGDCMTGGWLHNLDATGQTQAEAKYTLDGVTPDVNALFLENMATVSAGRNAAEAPDGDFGVQTPGSGLTVTSSYQSSNHELAIFGLSDCVWPHGTPEPPPSSSAPH